MAQLPQRQSQAGKMAPRAGNGLQTRQRNFDDLFGRLLTGWMAPLGGFEFPRVWDFDMTDKDREIIVRAEIPGFDENELDVQLNNNVLTIRAEKQEKGEEEQEFRSFYRAVTLPTGIDPEQVQATYRNGVLELRIPKREEAQPRRIKIEPGRSGQQPTIKQGTSGSASTQAQAGSQQTPSAGTQTPATGQQATKPK